MDLAAIDRWVTSRCLVHGTNRYNMIAGNQFVNLSIRQIHKKPYSASVNSRHTKSFLLINI